MDQILDYRGQRRRRFEPADPPLVLSLEPSPEVGRTGALNHLGFRLPDTRSLVAMQERLERVGLRTKREDGVELSFTLYLPAGAESEPVPCLLE